MVRPRISGKVWVDMVRAEPLKQRRLTMGHLESSLKTHDGHGVPSIGPCVVPLKHDNVDRQYPHPRSTHGLQAATSRLRAKAPRRAVLGQGYFELVKFLFLKINSMGRIFLK